MKAQEKKYIACSLNFFNITLIQGDFLDNISRL